MTENEPADPARTERLLARLRQLPADEPPPGWEARVDQRLAAERERARRGRWLWAGGAAVALAAAAAVYLVWLRPRARPPEPMSIAVVTGDGTRRARQATVGDTVRLTGHTTRRHGELRVYRDAALIARCPGEPTCRTTGARTTLDLTVTSPGPYSVVWLESDRPIPPPDADLDLDLLRAGQAGAVHHLDELTVAP
jgi:hypothetical protein